MLLYFLIGLSLVLTGIAGLQFAYLFYLDRVHRERKKYLQTLERKSQQLAAQLNAAEKLIAEQARLIELVGPETTVKDEMWADVIDER
ncbi:MAG: hypothetical protein ACKVRN_10445 [Pyrinomonadaceae bacterium]